MLALNQPLPGRSQRSPQQLGFELALRKQNARLVSRQMVTQLVALADDSRDESLVALDPTADDEEGRPCLVAVEKVQDPRCCGRVGAIVEGEGYELFLGFDQEQNVRRESPGEGQSQAGLP